MTADDPGRGGPGSATATAERRIRWGQWLGTVGVQGLGAVATLAVGLLIAAAQGPQAQGRYGLVRSTADLLLALGLCGLPQGIVHLLNHLRVAPARVEGWMRRHLALLLLLSAGLLGGAALTGFDPLAPARPVPASAGPVAAPAGPVPASAGSVPASSEPVAAPAGPVLAPAGTVVAPATSLATDRGGGGQARLALAVGVFGWVVHGLQRVFVLCRGSTPRFSWVSVAPALTLFAATAWLAWAGSQRYEHAVAFSGLASAAWAALAVRPLRRADGWRPPPASAAVAGTTPPTVRWTALLRPSLHALVQTAALALQPWLALQLLLRQVPAGSEEIGWFVFAGHVAQAFALPASFVAPLVFARASRAAGLASGRRAAALTTARRPIRSVGWITCGVSLGAAALLPTAVPALFGTAYAGAAGACAAMALCGPALVVGRLHTALLLGEGHFAAVTLLFALRAALLPVCMLALWRWTPWSATTAAAAGWALAETLVSIAQAALRTRRDRQSPPTDTGNGG